MLYVTFISQIKVRITFLVIILLNQVIFSQNKTVDSLNILLSKETVKSNKLELLSKIVGIESNTDLKRAFVSFPSLELLVNPNI
jgi:hypothetical protein